jgi:hypothetical protein
MKNRSPRSSAALFFALGLSALLAVACGGRAVTIEDGNASGGSDSSAGTFSAGAVAGKTGVAGFTSGGYSNGGYSNGGYSNGASAGAAATCGANTCPATLCGPNEEPITPPDACCPVCEPSCSQQICLDIGCANGFMSIIPPGQCCPTCVPISMTSCEAGKAQYATALSGMAEKYRYGCMTSTDCTVILPVNQCESGCDYLPVWIPVTNDFSTNLASEAANDCANCAPNQTPPCALPAFNAQCVAGQCTLGPILPK